MRMSQESYVGMNNLAGACFNANAIIDNLSYNLLFNYYNGIGDVVHLNVAHVMPEWADLITDKMLELGARPVRVDINGYDEEIADPANVFDILHNTLVSLLEQTRKLINSSDMNDDDEVRIFSESFLEIVSRYVKQSEEWMDACKKIGPERLNYHMKDYTHFIAL